MKSKLIYIIIFLIISSCGINKNLNNAQNKYLEHLSVIEDTFKVESSTNNLNPLLPSIYFLENITGIKSDGYEGFETYPIPTKKNLRQWKRWFVKNKVKLYFDKKTQKVKVKP